MKKLICGILFSFLVIPGYSQNYFKEQSFNVSVGTNGTLHRLECSIFDSVLQSTVYYNTDWMTTNITISSFNYGKVGFTTWNSPVNQNPLIGFIVYDSELHQFSANLMNVDLSGNRKVNVICGRIWITVAVEIPLQNYFYYELNQYRYNMHLHLWVNGLEAIDEATSIIWSLPPKGNNDFIILWWDDDFSYYDPVVNKWTYTSSRCSDMEYAKEDYLVGDSTCLDEYNFFVYDAEIHTLEIYPRKNIIGDHDEGLFYARQLFTDNPSFFFTYDQAIHQWVTDSVHSDNLTDIVVQDRVIAYLDSFPGLGKKVYYLVYDPISHNWIKDSSSVSGITSPPSILNGTVRWNDANGLNIRGYDSALGWGNYNTTIFLYFHLTHFASQGYPAVHVRNYSIGTESVFYDFGDGVISLNNRHVMWHAYTEGGNYDICITDSASLQSWCQQVNMNICSSSGLMNCSSDTLCQGDSATLSLPFFTGSIQWQVWEDSVWVDETGPGSTSSNYIVSPTQTSKYRATVTNGSCIPAYSNEQIITVYPFIGNSYMSDTTITKCANKTVRLTIYNANSSYQWQSNMGSGWNNIFSADEEYLLVNNSITTQYRVILSSGYCFNDTSDIVTVMVDSVPGPPVTIPGHTCGSGPVLLQATSTGTPHWYLPGINDSIINLGNTYIPFITNTSTFKVKSSSGIFTTAGYPDNSIGAVDSFSNQRKGLRIYCSSPAFLESLELTPLQSGIVKISLINSYTRELLVQESKTVTGGAGSVKLYFAVLLDGNRMYDLLIDSISVPVEINTSGINYPIVIPGSPVTVLGYVDSVFHNTNDFYTFYGINILTGCRSASTDVVATFYAAFNITTILPAGPLSFCQGGSVLLNSYPHPANFNYQWYLNGSLVASSGSNYMATVPGSYTLIMNNNLCNDTSDAVIVTVPCAPPLDPSLKLNNPSFQFNITNQQNQEQVQISATCPEDETYFLSITDYSGRELFFEKAEFFRGTNNYFLNIQSIASGAYLLNIYSNTNKYVTHIIKY